MDYTPLPIRSTLDQPEALARLQPILDGSSSRWAATRATCAAFALRDGRGHLRLQSCLSALEALDRAGRIRLPPARPGPAHRAPRTDPRTRPAPPLPEVPDQAGQIPDLAVSPVTDRAGKHTWAAMMAREHPLGPVRAAGSQIRYVLTSGEGVLGGFLCAAPTRVQAARDRWIGWTPAQCAAGRHRIVGLARFLIRPALGRCRNLASRALGLCLRRVVGDYEALYGLRPVLIETYVGPEHDGTSCRASGWIRVGQTAGRDRHRRPVAVKQVWLRPLSTDWRWQLGVRVEPLTPWAGLDSTRWAEQELAGADFGDVRLSRRLVQSAALLAQTPSKTFVTAARGDAAMVTGYYRLIEHPDSAAVSAQAILAPHRKRTRQRIQGQDTVLLIQDGSDINLATHQACEGLGVISRNRGSKGTLGLHLHTTLAVAADGIPLGVPRIEFDAPPLEGAADDDRDTKTQRWVRGLEDSGALIDGLHEVRAVAVMDREGDAFEVLEAWRRLEGRIHILVRARHDRSLGKGRLKLFERMRRQPVREAWTVSVPRLSVRRATGSQSAFIGRAARTAPCALRWKSLEIPVPEGRAEPGARAIRLSLVHVQETADPEDGAKPLEWLLLTSLPVSDACQAREVVGFYERRWRIEEFFRILKSGCDVETGAHRTRERVERAVALRAVIAWRLSVLALLGRETPGLEPGVLFSEAELAVIADFARQRRLEAPDNLGAAITLLARMGGYLQRRHDAPPGAHVVWEGYSHLALGADIVERARQVGHQSEVKRWISG